MLEKILSGLDLNNDEIKIYLNLLESGTITAGNLAKKIGMPRATLYDVLKKMTDKGVINRTLKQGVRSFTAAAPEKLDQLFKRGLITQKDFDIKKAEILKGL
jgi:sugar-specific transcriptional regulator TrmB